jgi:thioredoxin-like negative regulator of GroEL
MPAATAVVTCLHCGRRNRIASVAEGIPLLVLLRDGVEVDRRVGAHPEDALRAWLTPRVGGEPAPASPASPASA